MKKFSTYSKKDQSTAKQGFTLIELLVVVGIISVIAGIGGDMFATVMRTYKKAEIYSLSDKVGSGILTQIEQDVRLAIDVKVDTTYGNYVYLYIPKDGTIIEKKYEFSECNSDDPGYIKYSEDSNTPTNLVIDSTENLFKETVYVKKFNGGNFIARLNDNTSGFDLVYVSFVIGVGGDCTTPKNEVFMQSSVNLRGGLE